MIYVIMGIALLTSVLTWAWRRKRRYDIETLVLGMSLVNMKRGLTNTQYVNAKIGWLYVNRYSITRISEHMYCFHVYCVGVRYDVLLLGQQLSIYKEKTHA